MSQFTFQNFAEEFTGLRAADFTAAGERYFRYRGMDPNTAVVERHFLDFLHFLDLEELLREYHRSVGRNAGVGRASLQRLKTREGMPYKERPILVSQKSSSLVKRAIIKLETIQVK
jgi:hypothetical protein